jgi:ketosteroid isomerase-like protein
VFSVIIMPRYIATLVLTATLCGLATAATDTKAVEAAAHDAYVNAINSNDVDTLMAGMTDDIVYQSPNEPEIVGKAEVRAWVSKYFELTRTHWKKTSIGFTVNGDWAFERYTYESTDTDKKTSVVTHDTGKGINIFRRGGDGRWRVAVDGWSSDRPSGT